MNVSPAQLSAARWQDVLRARIFEALETRKLTPSEVVVIICLSDFADYTTGQNAYPSVATLTRRCAVSARTVERALAKARRLGLVELVKRGGGSGPSARGNTYRFLPDCTTATTAVQPIEFNDQRDTKGLVPHEVHLGDGARVPSESNKFGHRRGSRPPERESRWHARARRDASRKRVVFATVDPDADIAAPALTPSDNT